MPPLSTQRVRQRLRRRWRASLSMSALSASCRSSSFGRLPRTTLSAPICEQELDLGVVFVGLEALARCVFPHRARRDDFVTASLCQCPSLSKFWTQSYTRPSPSPSSTWGRQPVPRSLAVSTRLTTVWRAGASTSRISDGARARDLAALLGQVDHRHRLVVAADVPDAVAVRFEQHRDRGDGVADPAPGTLRTGVHGQRHAVVCLPQKRVQRPPAASWRRSGPVGHEQPNSRWSGAYSLHGLFGPALREPVDVVRQQRLAGLSRRPRSPWSP